MINFFSSSKNILTSKNILEIKKLGKYILPVCFIMLAILYAGTKPGGRNAARANAKDAKSAEECIEEIVGSGQRLDGMPVVVESRLIELDNLDVDEELPLYYYDWDIANGLGGGLVSDAEMGMLHRFGVAREFEMIGEQNVLIKWRKGQRFGAGVEIADSYIQSRGRR